MGVLDDDEERGALADGGEQRVDALGHLAGGLGRGGSSRPPGSSTREGRPGGDDLLDGTSAASCWSRVTISVKGR